MNTKTNRLLVNDRSFYRTFIRLCTALMLEQAVVLSVNLADNVMLGTYSEAALSGVAAVNQMQFVYQQVVYAIGSALITIASQYWGQKRLGEIRRICAVGMYFEVGIAAVLFVLASLFPRQIVRLFTDQSAFIDQGAAYLGIMRFSFLFFAMTTLLLNAMRVVEIVTIAIRVSFVSLVINVCINYLLIEGRFGLPEMGARGAAVGTLTARIVEFFIVSVFVLRDQKLRLRLGDLGVGVLRGGLFADFVKVLMPILASALLWGLTNAFQTVILGHMNDSAIAAQSISNTIFLLLKVTAVGAANAAAVIIGKTIGEGDMERLKAYTRTLQVIFVGIGAAMMLIMFFIRFPLLHIYGKGISPQTRSLANAYMIIQSVVLLLTSYQMPVNAGIIRGGGDVKFIMYLDAIAILVFTPLSAVAGLVWHWPAIAVIICMNADQLLKCFPAFIHGNSYKWVLKLTR